MHRSRDLRPRLASLFGVILMLPLVSAVGQGRDVEGTIRHDTTWTAADSPVILNGRVVVAEGVTLTIHPGVRVEGRPRASLVIRGTLRVEGTPDDPITFTSRSGRRDWQGIRFAGTQGLGGEDASSVLRYVVIERASAGVRSRYDSPQILGATFQRNGTGVELIMPTSDVAIRSSAFLRNDRALIGYTASTVSVSLSDFWNNDRNLIAGPKRWFDCVPDDGAWRIHLNDILRGPTQGWNSEDIRTTPGSYDSTYTVDARFNHWGTDEESDVGGRVGDESGPGRGGQYKQVLWEPILPKPVTPWEPPGPVNSPEVGSEAHGDPPTIAWVDHPKHGQCFNKVELSRIEGRGQALGKLRWVRVALARERSHGCEWLVDRSPRFERGSCARPNWLKPSGLGEWNLPTTKPLLPGRYRVVAATNRWEKTRLGQELGRNFVRFSVLR